MTAVPPLLRVIVYGRPATAGSKDSFPIYTGRGDEKTFTGRVSVVESKSPAKTSWAASVKDAGVKAIACSCGEAWCRGIRDGFPLDDALWASMVFTVPALKKPSATQLWPSTRPDALKYGRATEDHLTAAGVLTDDARVVRYVRLEKCYPGWSKSALPTAGAVIKLWRARDVDPAFRGAGRIAVPGSLFEQEHI